MQTGSVVSNGAPQGVGRRCRGHRRGTPTALGWPECKIGETKREMRSAFCERFQTASSAAMAKIVQQVGRPPVLGLNCVGGKSAVEVTRLLA